MSFNDGAPCSLNPNVWMSGKNRNIEKAKQGCAACGIRPACLDMTLEFEEMSGESRIGIYGGLTESERRNLRRTA